jgi:Na+/H+ antiporter NhaC
MGKAIMVTSLLTGENPVASWIFALVVLVLVSGIVWLLLHLVARTAVDIKMGVAEIWARGQRVANNTIHIAKAHEIADGVEAILKRAGGIAASAEAIKSHAETCPGCPACFLSRRRG